MESFYQKLSSEQKGAKVTRFREHLQEMHAFQIKVMKVQKLLHYQQNLLLHIHCILLTHLAELLRMYQVFQNDGFSIVLENLT